MKKPKKKKAQTKKASKPSRDTVIKKPSLGITPTGDRVLVRRGAPENVTSFGIVIPDTAKEKSEEGVVVAVGPGRRTDEGKLIAVSVRVGQRVRFSYGEEMKIAGMEYILVREENITATLD